MVYDKQTQDYRTAQLKKLFQWNIGNIAKIQIVADGKTTNYMDISAREFALITIILTREIE